MRAAVLTDAGSTPGVDDFREPDGDGMVVDVSLAGLNPVDLVIAKGIMPGRLAELPAVVGLEGVGHAGDGRRVYFDTPVAPFGSIAERALVDPEATYDVPEGVEDGLAVALGIAGLAAWLALDWRADLRKGETVLVLGSSGVVGQIAVQAAKLLGAGKVIAASRNDEDLEHSRSLGADETVKLGGDGDLAEAFAKAGGDGGIDVIVDSLWGEPAAAALSAIAMNGRLVQVGNSAAPSTEIAPRFLRNQIASILGHTNFNAPQAAKSEAFATMCGHAADGNLSVPVDEVPLEDIGEAWERQADGPHHKIVIDPT